MPAGESTLFAVAPAPTWVRGCVGGAEEETSTPPPVSFLFNLISFN